VKAERTALLSWAFLRPNLGRIIGEGGKIKILGSPTSCNLATLILSYPAILPYQSSGALRAATYRPVSFLLDPRQTKERETQHPREPYELQPIDPVFPAFFPPDPRRGGKDPREPYELQPIDPFLIRFFPPNYPPREELFHAPGLPLDERPPHFLSLHYNIYIYNKKRRKERGFSQHENQRHVREPYELQPRRTFSPKSLASKRKDPREPYELQPIDLLLHLLITGYI